MTLAGHHFGGPARRLANPGMVERRWGRLVSIGTVAMKEPHRFYNWHLANAHRAAVVGFYKTLSNEYAAHGVTANIIAPGRIGT